MSDDKKKILDYFLKYVSEVLENRVKKIFLYGSYACGDYNNNSDIDIMILTDLTDDEISHFSNMIWEKCADIEIDNEIVINPIIRNIDNFKLWMNVKPFYMNIINEGVVLGEK